MSSADIAEKLVAAANSLAAAGNAPPADAPVGAKGKGKGKGKAPNQPKQEPNGPFRINGRKLRINLAPPKEGDAAWPPVGFEQRDRPPIM